MADEYKAPQTTVEQDVQESPAPAPAPAQESFSVGRSVGKVGAWSKRTFPGPETAVIFGLIGLIAAILIFIVGIWRALIIALFVVVGVALGQVVDGDPKILRAVRRFISDRRD